MTQTILIMNKVRF